MSVQPLGSGPRRRRSKPPLLDIAAEVLVADPSASLAEVAEAAGIGRTTLHKHYATRDDLLRAVAHHAIDLCEAVFDGVPDDEDGGLRAVIEAIIPIGPLLAFLWRTPALDRDEEIVERWSAVEKRGLTLLARAQERGVLAAEVPDWWLLSTLYSLIYTAAESIALGRLAPRDAPGLVLATILRGLSAPPGLKHSAD